MHRKHRTFLAGTLCVSLISSVPGRLLASDMENKENEPKPFRDFCAWSLVRKEVKVTSCLVRFFHAGKGVLLCFDDEEKKRGFVAQLPSSYEKALEGFETLRKSGEI
jgi:hypothetical protein